VKNAARRDLRRVRRQGSDEEVVFQTGFTSFCDYNNNYSKVKRASLIPCQTQPGSIEGKE
jgi:hypothetical protein